MGGFTLWVFRFRALDLELLKLGTQWMLDFEMRGVDLRVRSEWVVSCAWRICIATSTYKSISI